MRRCVLAVLLVFPVTLLAPPLAFADVTPTSIITTIAGNRTAGFQGDGGPASQASLNLPRDAAIGPDGSIYVVDTDNNRIRRIAPDGIISTVAGNGSQTYNGDGIPATSASLYWPHDVTVDSDGTVYIADAAHHRIRRVSTNGVITTVGGTGVAGSSGDGGPAVNAQLKNPKSVELYGGFLYTAGLDNKVRRINLSTGIITRVAGTGSAAFSGDGGPALSATLNGPQRLAIDAGGNIFVADRFNNRIRRISSASGVITTVAGTGVSGLSGDGGPATEARLYEARGIAVQGDTLFIADSYNHRVRRVDLPTGIITTVAGTAKGFAGDGGPAGQAQLNSPFGVTVMPDGRLLIADSFNSVLRRVAADEAPPPPPPSSVELLSNRSVETSGEGFLGLWSVNDQVTWSADGGYDGTHAIRIANTAQTAEQAGMNTKPVAVSSTTAGSIYTGSVWVRAAQANQAVTLRLRECDSAGACGIGVAAFTTTLTDTNWHPLEAELTAKNNGDKIKYSVTAEKLAPTNTVFADLFSLVKQSAG